MLPSTHSERPSNKESTMGKVDLPGKEKQIDFIGWAQGGLGWQQKGPEKKGRDGEVENGER